MRAHVNLAHAVIANLRLIKRARKNVPDELSREKHSSGIQSNYRFT